MAKLHRLTDKQVENFKLPPDKEEHSLADGGNLTLRVRSGSKAWVFPYSFNGRRRKVYIGEYPSVSLAAARVQAAQCRALLAAGQDPRDVQQAAEDEAHAKALAAEHGEAPTTLGELFARWRRDYLKAHHADGGDYIAGIFERHVLPAGMAELRLSLMRPIHVKNILQRAQNSGLTGTVGRILDTLRQMFQWSLSFEWMDRDPTAGLKKKTFGGDTLLGDRNLSNKEVTQLHWRLQKSFLTKRWKHTIMLIAATGTRIEETMLAERSHVDLANRTWTIPVANQKKTNRKTAPEVHVVHLSAFAMKHMEALLAMPNTDKYIFPAVARGRIIDGPANEKTLTHALGNLQGVEHKGRRSTTELLLAGGRWTSHDIRRTTSTMMRECGVDSDVVDRCLNHVEPERLKRIYQRAELRELMEAAWEAVGAKLEALTSLPDPEPNYIVTAPKYRVLDVTDVAAVAARAAEQAAKAIRLAARKGGSTAPAVPVALVRAPVDYQDQDLI